MSNDPKWIAFQRITKKVDDDEKEYNTLVKQYKEAMASKDRMRELHASLTGVSAELRSNPQPVTALPSFEPPPVVPPPPVPSAVPAVAVMVETDSTKQKSRSAHMVPFEGDKPPIDEALCTFYKDKPKGKVHCTKPRMPTIKLRVKSAGKYRPKKASCFFCPVHRNHVLDPRKPHDGVADTPAKIKEQRKDIGIEDVTHIKRKRKEDGSDSSDSSDGNDDGNDGNDGNDDGNDDANDDANDDGNERPKRACRG